MKNVLLILFVCFVFAGSVSASPTTYIIKTSNYTSFLPLNFLGPVQLPNSTSKYVFAAAAESLSFPAYAAWRLDGVIKPGKYNVYVWKFNHQYLPYMAKDAKYYVWHKNGRDKAIVVDQSTPKNEWVYLGTYEFDNSNIQAVLVSNVGSSGVVIADALKLEEVVNNSISQNYLLNLPTMNPALRSYEKTSFDRSGLNDDGFSQNHTVLYNDSKLGMVVFDASGPGVLTRICMPFWSAINKSRKLWDDYDFNFYFDDEQKPRYTINVKKMFAKPPFPFLNSYNETFNPGTGIAYPWIIFNKRLRITATKAPYFHEIAWTRGNFSKTPPRIERIKPLFYLNATKIIKPNNSEDFLKIKKKGTIVLFEAQVSKNSKEVLQNLYLQMNWDGSKKPQVSVPLGMFFGMAFEEYPINSDFLVVKNGTYKFYLPMPFSNSADIKVMNNGSSSVKLSLKVGMINQLPNSPWGYFHAKFNKQEPTELLKDYVFLNETGEIKYVGTVMGTYVDLSIKQPVSYFPPKNKYEEKQLASYSLEHLEGDARIFVDGSNTPSHHGTGSETFFNWGWYNFPVDVLFSLPFHGQSGLNVTVSPFSATRTLFRFQPTDSFYSTRKLVVGIEHGKMNIVNANYYSTAYYYKINKNASQVSDFLDISDGIKLFMHNYKAKGNKSVSLTGAYEGKTMPPKFSVKGNSISGYSEFDMKLNGKNKGAILRVQSDATHAPMIAEVYIDGSFAGVWRIVRSNKWYPLRDSEFIIDPKYTKGKNSIRIKIKSVGKYPWKEFKYTIFSLI